VVETLFYPWNHRRYIETRKDGEETQEKSLLFKKRNVQAFIEFLQIKEESISARFQ